jgi:hypothetical protein
MWTRRLAIALVLMPTAVWATGTVNPKTAQWTAPTTNTDGSALSDLGSYNMYVAPSVGATCPTFPGAVWVKVGSQASTTTTPPANTTVSMSIPQQADGQKCVVITAVDIAGNESAGSVGVPFLVDRLVPSVPSGVTTLP